MVMVYALRLLIAGLALGLTMAWAFTRGLQSQLSGVRVTDSVTYGTAVIVLSCAVLAACLLPLRRALRFDPVTLLRA
jgi:ABC-type antimicrobial peptide transport system permease subunit